MRLVCQFGLLLSVLAVAGLGMPAHAGDEASDWARGFHSRARLVGGGSDQHGRLAGIEIALDAGYKTYWRSPGESGLPPTFDWARSVNVAAAEVLWPAPVRFADAGGISHGYVAGVILPVRVIPRDATRPVKLALTAHYGVCKDICIPARAELALTLPASATSGVKPALADHLRRVPEQRPLGGGTPGDLAVVAVTPATIDGARRLRVTVQAPIGAELFVEGPENWFLSASEREPADAAEPRRGSFIITVQDRPEHATGPVPLRLTLVSGARAIETTATLDATDLPR